MRTSCLSGSCFFLPVGPRLIHERSEFGVYTQSRSHAAVGTVPLVGWMHRSIIGWDQPLGLLCARGVCPAAGASADPLIGFLAGKVLKILQKTIIS